EGNKGDRDGDGIPDELDKCPDDPEDFDGFQDADGCPDPDNDGDGILDVDDLCPNDPEDKDGFEDADGCPDPDNDHDRIPDKDDKCPNDPENYNGYQDADGCPDKGIVERTESGIIILKPINFEFDKAIITKDSYPIVDAVAATMQGNPDILLIEVQGHTDEQGDDNYNLDLSQRRAAAVVKYLVDKGVDEKRLQAQGYGETQPKDPRHTPEAWAVNRRVEFVILKRATD
nr:OmpA family protein [Kofleriaceae bacterium]